MDPIHGNKEILSQHNFDSIQNNEFPVEDAIRKIGENQIPGLKVPTSSLHDFNISHPAGAASDQADKIEQLLMPRKELSP